MSKLELRIFQLKETMPERLIGTDCKFVGNPTLVRIQFVSFLRHKKNNNMYMGLKFSMQQRASKNETELSDKY